jgi:hypothetical protein
MHTVVSRGGSRPLALGLAAIIALGACAEDDPTPTAPRPAATLGAFLGADTITVTNAGGGSAVGSIRWATGVATDSAIIRFAPSLDGATILLDSTILVRAAITIEGPENNGVTLSGGDKVRVIDLGEPAHLKNLTITRGYHPVAGGGIHSTHAVYLEHSTVSHNSAPDGGGIYARGVQLVNSTVARNSASGSGSGISFNADDGGVWLYSSTVAQNGPATGIESRGFPNPYGGSYLNHSIIADNGLPLRNCGTLYDVMHEGFNISDDTSCGGSDVMVIADPKLGVLADHGGPSPTVDFAPDSPALNTGTACYVTVDQRYVPRDARCDPGAFEFTDFTKVTLTIDPGATVDAANGTAVVTGTMTCSRAGGAFGVLVHLRQRKGGKSPTVVSGSGGVGMTCATSNQPWRATVTPGSGAFEAGSAAATASMSDVPQWITPASTSASVKLARARK